MAGGIVVDGPFGRGEIQYAETFETITPGIWQGRDPPRPDWMVEGLFLRGTVAMISGDGAIGKSMLCQSLCSHAVLGRPWLDNSLQAGRALYFSCEDDHEELWRRQCRINRALGCEHADLDDAGFHIRSMVGQDAALIKFDRGAWKMKTTELFMRLFNFCRRHGIQYVIIDTATKVFRGNQNDETQVDDFITELRRLAIAIQGVVIITKHPSMAGRALGTGESGSVVWNNSVRSRLYVYKDKLGNITLKTMKANYAKSGGTIPLRWERGALVLDKPAAAPNPYD